MENQWYCTKENGWYKEPAEAAPAAEKKQKENTSAKNGLIAAAIALGVTALIAASCIAFAGKGTDKAEGSDSFFGDNPFAGEEGESTLPDNFQSFFEQYYTDYETAKPCDIPRAENLLPLGIYLQPEGEEEYDLEELYQKCAPSVVAIRAYTTELNDAAYSWGTGVIMSADGYVITNAHVIAGTCRAKIILWNDEEYDAYLVGTDNRSDIAVLKADTDGLIPAEFGESDGLRVGQQVVAIGNPIGEQFRNTMTDGIISGIDRDVSHNGITLSLLQVTTPINEGNSGGPLFNRYGQVIGITNMKMSASYIGAVTIEGVGFAIPSATVKEMAESLIRNGLVTGRPALGLTVGQIPEEALAEYNLPSGLYISRVSSGSDCEKKGIEIGEILLEVNGNPVTVTTDVTSVVDTLGVGDTMELTIWHATEDGGIIRTVTVALVDYNDVY